MICKVWRKNVIYENEICEKYDLFPDKEEWNGKILFIETSEEKPTPELFEKEIVLLKDRGIFDVINGVLVGKPQDEVYYQEYKDISGQIVCWKICKIKQ